MIHYLRCERKCYGAGTARQRIEQSSQVSIRNYLAKQYKFNPRTIVQCRKRADVADVKETPVESKHEHSTVQIAEEAALIVAFRKHTMLSLDDCLYVLQDIILHLTHPTPHRCLRQQGISCLPEATEKTRKIRFKVYPISTLPRHCESTFVTIDTTSKFAFAAPRKYMPRATVVEFLRHLIAVVRHKSNTIWTDNHILFTNHRTDRYSFLILFGHIYAKQGTEHRSTILNQPWMNGQIKCMNLIVKEIMACPYYYDMFDQLGKQLTTFPVAYSFAKHLMTLLKLMPYKYNCLQCQRRREHSLIQSLPPRSRIGHLGAAAD